MDRLLQDVISSILVRLPFPSVARCRYVCKAWQNITNDHRFRDLHLTRTQDSPGFLFVLGLDQPNEGDAYFIEDDGVTFRASKLISCSKYGAIHIVGSSRGLLCFTKLCDNGSIHICNPTTGETVRLPDDGYNWGLWNRIKAPSGFEFVPSTNEYKLVKFIYAHNNGGYELQVLKHTLGSDTWRKLKNVQSKRLGKPRPQAFVNESFHFLSDHEFNNKVHGIVSFDLKNEEFGVVPIPEGEFSFYDTQLGVIGGCLPLIDFSSMERRTEIWVMKEYNIMESWTKLYSFSSRIMHASLSGVQPILSRKNGEVILLYNDRLMTSCKFGSEECTRIEVEGLPKLKDLDDWGECEYEACPYAGNFISLKELGVTAH